MSAPYTEVEAKFVVSDLEAVRRRLDARSARLVTPRHRETNFRFDLPQGSLRAAGTVLRLRQGLSDSLTLKTPGRDPEHRQEIEFTIGDPEKARLLLETLGYQVVFVYEKDREVYAHDDARVMLDALPFGDFVEIEADDVSIVRRNAESLGFPWDERVRLTYHGLFEALRTTFHWPVEQATFAGLAPLPRPTIEELLAETRPG